jgi:hypothetical protein
VAQAAQLSQLGLPSEVVSSVFESQAGGGAGGMMLTPEDIGGIAADARVAAVGDPTKGVAPMSLHDARMQIMNVLRSQGYPESELAKAYDTIGRTYQAAGGQIGQAPMTWGERGMSAAAPSGGLGGLAAATPAAQPRIRPTGFPDRSLLYGR